MTPTQRTLKALREDGFLADIVERYISFGGPGSSSPSRNGVRKDLFGIFDILACAPGKGIIGIQCFSTDWTGHYRTLLEEKREECLFWLNSGGQIEMWGWRKLKVKRGGKAVRWTPRIEVVTLDTFNG